MFVLKTVTGGYVSFVDLDKTNRVQVMASSDIEDAMTYTNLTIASIALIGFSKLGCEFTIEEIQD